jgi:hypothetical protein
MITIFSIPKPFDNNFGRIQENAIRSWLFLDPKPEIILFGNEDGTKEICEKYKIQHFADVSKNEYGTPLIGDIFEKAQKTAKNLILCYVNCDIIFLSDFMMAINLIKNEDKFLMVGRRWDFNLEEEIDFGNPNWERNLKENVLQKGKLHPPTGIDYFVFKNGLWKEIPSFSLRTVWDQWLLWRAWKMGVKIIDASEIVTAIHQNHPYVNKNSKFFDPWKTKEAKINLKLAGGYKHCLTIEDADYFLTLKGIEKKSGMSFIRRLDLLPVIGILTRQRFKIKRIFKK